MGTYRVIGSSDLHGGLAEIATMAGTDLEGCPPGARHLPRADLYQSLDAAAKTAN
jgi:hypothetical protein